MLRRATANPFFWVVIAAIGVAWLIGAMTSGDKSVAVWSTPEPPAATAVVDSTNYAPIRSNLRGSLAEMTAYWPAGTYRDADVGPEGVSVTVDADGWQTLSSQDSALAVRAIYRTASNCYNDAHVALPAAGLRVRVIDLVGSTLYDDVWRKN